MLQAAGQGLVRRFGGGRGNDCPPQVNDLGLRRITQAGIGTALESYFHLAGGTGRYFQLKALAVNLLLTEKFIAVRFARGQGRLVLWRQAVELQTLLVQIVPIGDLPKKLGFTGLQALGSEDERLAYWKEVRFGREWIVGGLGHARYQENEKQ